MKKLLKRLFTKEDPSFYETKDSKLKPTLTTKDLLGLGVGIIIGAAIFTLPGVIAAEHTGPAVALSFIMGGIGAGLAAFAYAETASVLPYAGSAFSWMSVLFGDFIGWLVGWALLAEYFIAVAFVSSGWSAYFQGFLRSLGISIPTYLSSGFNPKTGGVVDIFAAAAILFVGYLLMHGMQGTSRIENFLAILKVVGVLLFVIVGATAIHYSNYVPFIPAAKPGTTFGGFNGIMAGTAEIFLAYVGFDALASNTSETKNPEKSMPRGIISTLIIGTTLFVLVSLVLVGMFKYTRFANNAEPAAWALRHSGHMITANVLSIIVIIGIFAGIIGLMLACSRLLYSFGRDGLLPQFEGHINKRHLPGNAIITVTIAALIVGSMFPFTFLANLVSGGTLIAFIAVSLGIYALRPREGKDLPKPKFKMPLYPILPGVSALFCSYIFLSLGNDAKMLMLIWFIIGIIIYFTYGIKHSHVAKK